MNKETKPVNRIAQVASFLLCISIGIPSRILIAQNADGTNQQKDVPIHQSKELRDIFLGKETASTPAHQMVGRLGILLATRENLKQVRPDYSFQSGDRFRLEVTANRDGWLYVLHAAPGGALKLLWPRSRDDNSIKSGQTYEIPLKPGVFIFDKDVGQEYFYIAIRPNQRAKKASTNITNFVIRDPFGETGRGVVFDPGDEDGDPYLYFSAVAEDNRQSAMIEFRLRHVE